jgi:hypothetical protein
MRARIGLELMFRVAQAPLDLNDRFCQVPDALLNFGVDVPRLARHRLCARRGALIVLERFVGALGMVSSFRAARSQHVSVKPESTSSSDVPDRDDQEE